MINKSPFTANADCRETLRKVRATLESGWDNDLSHDVDIARFMLRVPDRKQCGSFASINRDCRKKISRERMQIKNQMNEGKSGIKHQDFDSNSPKSARA